MYTIVQGANVPIVIKAYNKRFEGVYDVEVSMFSKSCKLLKSWDDQKIKIDSSSLTLPLEESETINFEPGMATLEIKWVDKDQSIAFAPVIQLMIEKRNSRTEFKIPCAISAKGLEISLVDSFSSKEN